VSSVHSVVKTFADSMSLHYTTIIGLEVHVQLATASKLFCGCSTRFGGEPNTQTCPVCIGMPGSLPVMNRRAVELALKTAVALQCEIPPRTKWDRKQYYYPDLPKGYQISQFDLPMSHAGRLAISDTKDRFAPKDVRIIRAHLEEDAGKSLHDEEAGKGDSLIDLNRTGTPLLEIVSEPDLRSSAESLAFLKELRLLLTYIAVSDCNMQEGSLRVDANINLHFETPAGKVATPIVEIKNMNSFRAVERALDYEAPRQYREWQETGRVLGQAPKQTRGWDDAAGVTRAQRSKEESSDYRYFPDPDLVPVSFSAAEVDSAKASLGELPATLRALLQAQHGLSNYDADVIVNQGRELVDFYVDVAVRSGDSKLTCRWVTQELLALLNRRQVTISQLAFPAERLVSLIKIIKSGEIPSAHGGRIIEVSVADNIDIHEAVNVLKIKKVDESAIEELCQELIAANPGIVADVQSGKVQAIGALVGQAKKKNSSVDPSRVREIFLRLIQSGP
jgi:aspartyl-tRNA(Asn)/glutamyl-tRNA(Gln) amidotransferase subunit B